MLSDERLRIAVPSKGRLQERALELLANAGLRFRVSGRRLFADCRDTETRIIFTNTADIPILVNEGVVDLGVTGSDQVEEAGVAVQTLRPLGFGRCRLSVAVHKDSPNQTVAALAGKVVGAKFVNLARAYFEREGVADVHVLPIQGAVEVMVLLGLVDAIVEIVETGNSLIENDLVEIATVLAAESVLIGNDGPRNPAERDRFLRRVDGALAAARYSLLEYNCPGDQIEAATRITPGYSSPTVLPLREGNWMSVKVMVEKDTVHGVVDALEALGCVAILETALRHARL